MKVVSLKFLFIHANFLDLSKVIDFGKILATFPQKYRFNG